MAMLGAIECIRTGSTGTAEVAEGIERYAESIVASGVRWFLAECSGDGVTGPGYKPGEPVTEFSDARPRAGYGARCPPLRKVARPR